MTGNVFFDNMYTTCCEWQERSTAHNQQKQEILKTYGWNSPEMEAWEAKEEPFPFSQGAVKAMQAYRSTEGDELIVDDHFWETETADFIDTLRKAGIRLDEQDHCARGKLPCLLPVDQYGGRAANR